MLYATVADPSDAEDGMVSCGIETHVEAAVKRYLLLLWTYRGHYWRYYCLRSISKGWIERLREWGAVE